jgi:hypothetical protein
MGLGVAPFDGWESFLLPPRKLSRAPRCRTDIGRTADASSKMAVPLVSDVRIFPFSCPVSVKGDDRCQVSDPPDPVSLRG